MCIMIVQMNAFVELKQPQRPNFESMSKFT